MAKKPAIKTNAIRLIEAKGVPFSVYEYDVSDGKIDGVSVANKVGMPVETVFKTLVTRGKSSGINVFIVPVECELDLKKAAAAANDKYIEMLKSKDLLDEVGYVHGGCSPIGMKKLFPTYIEEAATLNEKIVVSGGQIGLQVELSVSDLQVLTNAIFADLV